MEPLEFIDPEYQAESHSRYHLYLELSEKAFRAVFIDPLNLKVCRLLDSNNSSLEDFLNRLGKIQESKTLVAIANRTASLIPESIFEEKAVADYMNLINDTELKIEDIRWDNLPSVSANLVYAVETELITKLESKINQVSIGHHASFFIYLCSLEQAQHDETVMYVNLDSSRIDLAVFNAEDLQFYNAFQNYGNQDPLYHIAHVAETLKIPTQHINCKLSGSFSQSQIEQLGTYLGSVNRRSIDSQLKLPPNLIPENQLTYHSLIQLHLCE